MKNLNKTLLQLIFILLVSFPITTFAKQPLPTIPIQQSIAPEKNYVKGEVIVKYKDVTEKDIQSLNFLSITKQSKKQLQVQDNFKDINIAVIKSEKHTTQELIKELEQDDNVEYVEPNYIKQSFWVPNDTEFSSQWSHHNTGQLIQKADGTGYYAGTTDADIDTPEMWDLENAEATTTTVAVIDSGAHYAISDISQNMWDGTGCVNENNSPIAGGCPYHGWDYYNNDNNPDDTDTSSIEDDTFQGHGTFITSIISSTTNNSNSIAGISKYNNIKTMALRFDLTTAAEIKAINFAKYNGAKVINASFGGNNFIQSEKDAISTFPGMFIAASGNSGDNNDTESIYPCNYNLDNIICVGASDQDDDISSFSNYGSTNVDLLAPGENIYSLGYCNNGASCIMVGSGTSFSAPYVAGIAGILYAHNNTLSQTQVRDLILDNVDNLSISDIATGGRLNAHNSLSDLVNNIGLVMAPNRFDRVPTSNTILPENTTNTQISLRTNVNATCKYSTVRNQSYNSMPYSMTALNGTTHTATISGLQNGGNYTYYIRCSNTTTGIKNTNDYIINFFINTPMYRLYNTKTGVHLYTRGEADRDKVLRTWPEFEFTDGAPAFWAKI
jgi:hypothetical protein